MSEFENARDDLKKTLEDWVFKSIENTYSATKDSDKGTPLSAFILVSCAIDFLSGFRAGLTNFKSRGIGKNYQKFVKAHFKSVHYTPEQIWYSLRCALVHNYVIERPLGLANAQPYHGKKMRVAGNQTLAVINYEDFYREFRAAVDDYFSALEMDSELQENFLKRARLGWARVAAGTIEQ